MTRYSPQSGFVFLSNRMLCDENGCYVSLNDYKKLEMCYEEQRKIINSLAEELDNCKKDNEM